LKITACDLFCGAGGFSEGLLAAADDLGYDVDLLAVNHWDVAIATHSTNHPGVRHLCETLDSVDPRKAIPDGRLDLLVASPECIHHSHARGGKPMSDQSRATAWHVLRWAEALYVENIIVENVKEFRDWGPLDENGRPIKRLKGALYKQFIRSLRALGYTVEDRVLVAADYGDPTTRQRLFIRARRGGGRIAWPSQTHVPIKSGTEMQWRPARDVIDWSIEGDSIFNRPKPLADRTMERIMTGLKKYSGIDLVGATVDLDGASCDPFLVVLRNHCDARSLDEPVPTVAARGNHIALATPFIVNMKGQSIGRDIDTPLPTITAHAPHLYVAEPYLVPFYSEREGQEPRTHSLDEPLPTVTGCNRFGVAQPFILKYYGNGDCVNSIDQPLGTVTGKDRFALVNPIVVKDGKQIGVLDIRFRMLQPKELALAMSFPSKYTFTGTKADQVKQIGNAVPCETAKALCKSALQRPVSRRMPSFEELIKVPAYA
jgi:DNA (cytosine-5)-methyltransferase 1